jgi:DNA-binding response OmpR family regulator
MSTNNLTIRPSSVRPDTRFRKPLILIVEDHEDTRFLLRYVMETRGYQVIEAADGEEGVVVASATQPDLILMDTDLPHVDGLAATKRIRAFSALNDVRVIFISGHAQPEARLAALATGGTDYLVKPVQLSELEAAVERELIRFRTHKPTTH